MEKNMENEMETVAIKGLIIGIMMNCHFQNTTSSLVPGNSCNSRSHGTGKTAKKSNTCTSAERIYGVRLGGEE